ncbi:MAG: translation initiation factor IF-2 [Muribaculaceae bacterium]|nr:translation initiation factor IF-2 [Muribaculaceae bacterium]
MARIKISKVAKDLNVSVATVVEALRKKNITVPDDNPNFRLEEAEADILYRQFKVDKDQKNKSEQFSTQRQKERKGDHNNAAAQPQAQPAPAKPAEVPEITTVKRPVFVGKIDLKTGKPIEESKPEAPKPAPAPKPEPKPQPAPEVKPQPAPAPKPDPKQEPNPEPKPAQQAPAPKPQPKPEHKQEQKPSPKPQPKPAGKPAPAPKPEPKAEPAKTEPAKPAKPEIFTLGEPQEAPVKLNVVGKIDLSAINQSTRPKKKTKEERRREARAQHNGDNGQQGGGNGGGDRKKRRRIDGKQKVDIEKTVQQQRGGGNGGGGNNHNRPAGQQNQGGQQQGQGGGKGRAKDGARNRGNRNNTPQHAAVNEEDVQKQVRETLARLTAKDKGQKKATKWRKEKREAFANREREAAEQEAAESRTLKLTEFVTANDLASMMDVPINQVIGTCMNIGVMVSINQRLDAETINIVAEEFGFTTEYVSAEVVEAISQDEDREEDLVSRPPIVTVMGHVDHGKTSLLDYIRKANVIAGEAGGITQHIGAYNVKLPDGRHLTFLDTPGHEAFTAMRARGAKVTDLCIIIVAADDNVMPQTVEAINHASAAGVPIVFAINKIDKPHANPDKIKEELAGMNYLVEDWGGKYQSQDISAKKGTGVEELMEKVLLEAEMLELKANPNRKAIGSIIESSLDKGRGYVATVLVQNGTLRVGDTILAGTHYGRVKAMFNERNQRIKEAGPATPALILGLNGAPTAGDTFNVLDTEQEAREIASKREQLQRELGLRTKKLLSLEDIGRRRAIGNFQELNIIVKGDVDGSIEALSDSLIKLSTEEIQVNVLHKAVGAISESDVTLASASDAIIIGFQVRPSMAARKAAERDGVEIRLYSVIYQAIEEVKDAMSGMLAPELKEEITGSAEVLETFHISKIGTIAGCLVRDGKIKRGSKCRLIRDGIVKYTGELASLKRFKDDVKEVLSGYDCGMSIAGYNDIHVGDFIEGFEEVEVNRSL